MRAVYSFRGHHIVAEGDSLSALGEEIGRKIGAILVLDGDVKRAVFSDPPRVRASDAGAPALCARRLAPRTP